MEWVCAKCARLTVSEFEPTDRLCSSCAKEAIDFARIAEAKRKRQALRDAIQAEERRAARISSEQDDAD